jgi:hypothetical protein
MVEKNSEPFTEYLRSIASSPDFSRLIAHSSGPKMVNTICCDSRDPMFRPEYDI